MSFRCNFAFGLALAVSTRAFCFDALPPPGVLPGPQYVFRAFGQAEGLNDLAVTAFSIDSLGFPWIGTENGVYRFLGSGLQWFGPREGIEEAIVQDVLATPDGNVWVGTARNLYRWTGDRFEPAGPKGIRILRAGSLKAEAPQRLLVIDGNGLKRFRYDRHGKVQAYDPVFPDSLSSDSLSSDSSDDPRSHVSSFARGPDGMLWFGCERKICSWQPGTEKVPERLVQWDRRSGVPDEVCETLLFDRQGSLWAATDHHLIELPRAGTRFIDRTLPGGREGAFYQRLPMATDGDGRLLVSADDGVARWDGSAWQTIGPASGLRSAHISTLTFDAGGNLWLGSTGHGLHYWAGYRDWEGWSEAQGLPSANIWSVGLFDGATAFVGTDKGPATIDVRTGIAGIPVSGKWKWGQVSGLVRDARGTVWAGTQAGEILRILPAERPGMRRPVVNFAKLEAFIFAFVSDASGRIFATTNRGIYIVDPAAVASTAGAAPPQPEPAANALFDSVPAALDGCVAPDGSVWFVTRKGPLRFARGKWSRPATAGLGASHLDFEDIACGPDGDVWLVGHRSGIWRMTPRQDNTAYARPLPFPEEYRDLSMLAVAADRRGWIWVGTDAGLLAWNGSSWRRLTQETGLIWNDVNGGRMRAGPDGSIWIGTSGGLARITHPEAIFAPHTLSLSMLAIRWGGNPVLPEALGRLPWFTRGLSFQFASPDVVSRGDLCFRYRIPQLDSVWTETKDTVARFAAIPPGDYTFEAVARNPALGSESPAVEVHFTIEAPWWRSRLLFVCCAFVAALLLRLCFQLRTRHLLKQQRVLEGLIRERTLELEASRHELEIQATHDGLTGLLNRVAILNALERELNLSRCEQNTLTVVLVDLDHFKRVNDTWGHAGGDRALQRFAEAVSGSIRASDYAGRYGGEEFLLVLPGIPPASVRDRLDSLHECISNLLVRHEGAQFRVTCSAGAIVVDPKQLDPAQAEFEAHLLLAAADQAMYEAKDSGRNRIVHRAIVAAPSDREWEYQSF